MLRLLPIAAWLAATALAAGASASDATGRIDRFADGSLGAMEQRLFADAADGRLDRFSPLGAALVAGGVESDDSLGEYEQKAAALADGLCSPTLLAASPSQQVEAVFEFLHRRVLRGGYDLAATDLRRTLDEGRFNCVSATVMFNYFAGRLGLKCRGLEMPGHAMSRVLLAGGAIDVETTCPHWVRLPCDPQRRTATASKAIGAAATADRSKAREVSPIQLAAMIYYNRGVDELAAKRFSEAAAANAKSLRLDPGNATARGNLLAVINNWSIELGNSRHFAEAMDLLRQGMAIEPGFDAFTQNYVHIQHQWVERLCDEGRFEDAIVLLSRASDGMSNRDYVHRAEIEVRRRWAQAVVSHPQIGPLLEWPCVKDAGQVD